MVYGPRYKVQVSLSFMLRCLNEHILDPIYLNCTNADPATVGLFSNTMFSYQMPITGESNFFGAECFTTAIYTMFEEIGQKSKE